MIALIYALIALVFFALGMGGMMYIDHRFSLAVGDRPFAVKGRRIETDDPFVAKQFRKFYAIRVAYSVLLIVLLIVVASNVG